MMRARAFLVTLVLAAICSLRDFREYRTCIKTDIISLSDNAGRSTHIKTNIKTHKFKIMWISIITFHFKSVCYNQKNKQKELVRLGLQPLFMF